MIVAPAGTGVLAYAAAAVAQRGQYMGTRHSLPKLPKATRNAQDQNRTFMRATTHLGHEGGAASPNGIAGDSLEVNLRSGHIKFSLGLPLVARYVPAAEGPDAIRTCQRTEHKQEACCSHSWAARRSLNGANSVGWGAKSKKLTQISDTGQMSPFPRTITPRLRFRSLRSL